MQRGILMPAVNLGAFNKNLYLFSIPNMNKKRSYEMWNE